MKLPYTKDLNNLNSVSLYYTLYTVFFPYTSLLQCDFWQSLFVCLVKTFNKFFWVLFDIAKMKTANLHSTEFWGGQWDVMR